MSEPTKDSVEYIANKFAENPGHFAATILRMYWDMEKQRDQYKSENEKLRERNKKLEKRCNQKVRRNVRGGLQQMKIEDLESKNEQLKQDLLRTEELQDEIIQLEKDFENKHNLLSEFSQHIGNKPSSSTYKYFREKLDGIGIKEGE